MIDGLSHIPVIVSDPNKIKIILMKVLDAKILLIICPFLLLVGVDLVDVIFLCLL